MGYRSAYCCLKELGKELKKEECEHHIRKCGEKINAEVSKITDEELIQFRSLCGVSDRYCRGSNKTL